MVRLRTSLYQPSDDKEVAVRATTPEQVLELFASALNSRDVDAAISLYEPEATFTPRPGEEVAGLSDIRSALDQFVAIQPRLSGEVSKVLVADDIALVQNRWQLQGTQPDGSPVAMGGHSADVLRRAPDGTWRILIDDPWGAGGQ